MIYSEEPSVISREYCIRYCIKEAINVIRRNLKYPMKQGEINLCVVWVKYTSIVQCLQALITELHCNFISASGINNICPLAETF
jgi:hypothetical protein